MTTKPDNDTKRFVTTKEAAQMLGLSVSSVQKMVTAGELDAWTTAGGHRRVYRESVLRCAHLARAAAPGVSNGRLVKVLLTEDNPLQMKLMQNLIATRENRLAVSTATDASDALIKVERQRPDLVITDLIMEPFDGFHLIKTMEKDPTYAGIDILVVTGLSAKEIEARGGLPEWVQVYHKPVQPDLVRGYLDAHISRLLRN